MQIAENGIKYAPQHNCNVVIDVDTVDVWPWTRR